MTDKTVREEIDVLDCSEGNGEEDIEISVTTMIDKLRAALERVPEGLRDKAIFRISASGEYAHAYLCVRYDRPETDDERRAREQASQRHHHAVR